MSSQLRVDTDQMHAMVQQIQRSNQVIEEQFALAQQSIIAMQQSMWSGRHRIAAEEAWSALSVQFSPAQATIADIACRVQRTADAYEDAARVFGGGGTGAGADILPDSLPSNNSLNIGNLALGLVPIGVTVIGKLNDIKEGISTIKALNLMKQLDFRKGSYYANQVIISGSRKVKGVAFLKPGTTSMAWGSAFKGQLFSGLGTIAKGTAVFTAITSAIGSGVENYKAYKDDPQSLQKITVATALDATVKTAIVTGSTVGGAIIGGAVLGGALGAISGGTLAPFGVAVGKHVGGFLGGLAGDWAADTFMNSEFYQNNKEYVVQKAADIIDQGVAIAKDTAKTISHGVNEVRNAAQEAAKNVGNAVGNTIGGFAKLFGR